MLDTMTAALVGLHAYYAYTNHDHPALPTGALPSATIRYNGPAGLLELYHRAGGTQFLQEMELEVSKIYRLERQCNASFFKCHPAPSLTTLHGPAHYAPPFAGHRDL